MTRLEMVQNICPNATQHLPMVSQKSRAGALAGPTRVAVTQTPGVTIGEARLKDCTTMAAEQARVAILREPVSVTRELTMQVPMITVTMLHTLHLFRHAIALLCVKH